MMAMMGLEILMSRLHHCGELLRGRGVESDILAGMDNDVPVLMIYFPEGDVQLTCLPMDEDDSFAHFLLDIRTEVDVSDLEFVDQQTVCDLFSDASMAGMAYLSHDLERVVYRQVIPEAQLPTTDETFLYAMELYVKNLELLHQVIAAVSGSRK